MPRFSVLSIVLLLGSASSGGCQVTSLEPQGDEHRVQVFSAQNVGADAVTLDLRSPESIYVIEQTHGFVDLARFAALVPSGEEVPLLDLLAEGGIADPYSEPVVQLGHADIQPPQSPVAKGDDWLRCLCAVIGDIWICFCAPDK